MDFSPRLSVDSARFLNQTTSSSHGTVLSKVFPHRLRPEGPPRLGHQVPLQSAHQESGQAHSRTGSPDVSVERYPDHQGACGQGVHLYVSYRPKLSVSEMMRLLKGRSSRKVQQEFPQLSKQYWGKHFWGIGYGAFSSGHVTDAMIREYLDNHDKHPNWRDDDFVVE